MRACPNCGMAINNEDIVCPHCNTATMGKVEATGVVLQMVGKLIMLVVFLVIMGLLLYGCFSVL